TGGVWETGRSKGCAFTWGVTCDCRGAAVQESNWRCAPCDWDVCQACCDKLGKRRRLV
ncbi:unnamed protein product, partial [Polarella glacialis]